MAIYLVNAGQMEANEVNAAVEDVPALAKRAAAAVDYSSLEAVMGGGSMLELEAEAEVAIPWLASPHHS